MDLRSATTDDAEALRTIYNREVLETTHTFDLEPRTLEQQEEWIRERDGALGVVVAEVDDVVVGFASLSPYRPRPAYRTSVENSVYVAESARGTGVGRALLEEVIEVATGRGFHTIIARISGGHEASIGLHHACGFQVIGTEQEVGRKFGKWLDVVVMQRMLA
jgi:phosphinothricin acetyltransferase